MKLDTARVRALNDEVRHNLPNAHAMITAGIAALGAEAVARIVQTIAVYDDFCHANDPYEEHDFTEVEVGARSFDCASEGLCACPALSNLLQWCVPLRR